MHTQIHRWCFSPSGSIHSLLWIHNSQYLFPYCVSLGHGDPQDSVVYSYMCVSPTLSLFAPITFQHLHGNLMLPFSQQAELQHHLSHFFLLWKSNFFTMTACVCGCLQMYTFKRWSSRSQQFWLEKFKNMIIFYFLYCLIWRLFTGL